MKTVIYILFRISLSEVHANKMTKSEYLRLVSKALENNLLREEDAFNLTMKAIGIK